MASEEMDSIHWCPTATRSRTCCCSIPDGSSNIDVNVSIGTIFSVLKTRRRPWCGRVRLLQPGSQQVAAGYCVYGPRPPWC